MSMVNLNTLLEQIIIDKREIDFTYGDMQELLRNVTEDYFGKRAIYTDMYNYYKGYTDAMAKYKILAERSNLFTNVNYFKKFVREEVSYTVGNRLTYESRKGNKDFVEQLELNTYHWNENHDTDLMKYLLIFTRVYELYYRDRQGRFCSRIINPINGYAYRDFNGNVLFFVHMHTSQFKEDVIENDTAVSQYRTYYDVYTDKYVYYFDENYREIKKRERHKFSRVPVSVGVLTYEDYNDSLYADIKGLQDALETNLSDIANEISDFRNAYLLFKGCTIEDKDLTKFKKRGAIEVDSEKADVRWLIKEINDTFIQNTMDRYIDLLYQVSSHINHNEKLQSNLSSLTLRSRLIALEHKCTLNIKAHRNVVKDRISFLCEYLNSTETLEKNKLDERDIKVSYTPNIPQDDQATAQMLSQLPPGTVSKATGRAQLSFINNPAREEEKVLEETRRENELLEDEYKREPIGATEPTEVDEWNE